MSSRSVRFILALYPRSFRRRYGREVQDLVNDLAAAGERSRLWLVSGLMVSAVSERLQALRSHARLTVPTLVVVAALGATVELHWSHGGQRFPRAAASARGYLPPTTEPSTRRGTVDAATGRAIPLPGSAAAANGRLPPPPLMRTKASTRPWR
jgi:hypothetical protein